MTSNIRIKLGNTEIDFEGSEEYIRDELPNLIGLLTNLAPSSSDSPEEESEVLPESSDSSKKTLQMTTNTIATKTNAKSGADLAIAACAHLSLVKGQDSFRRTNILGEMKLANNFYKKTYSNNLSSSLKTLVKANKLLETSDDTYALESNEKKRLESLLGGS